MLTSGGARDQPAVPTVAATGQERIENRDLTPTGPRRHGDELRFFGGLDVKETADVLKISEETVTRDWKFAKVWLMRELSRTGGSK
jgi:hypothetical protein